MRHRARAAAAIVLLSLATTAFCTPSRATAAQPTPAEQQLAERFAPVVRIVRQTQECGPGEPYRPSDVDAFLGNDSVALRGPWTTDDLVKIAPAAADLGRGLDGYHLDFPGNPLAPGCDYERWARTQTRDTQPVVYAHVATEQSRPGRLSLQYWFYYPFNDFNNKHESDWEMIQLEFAATDPAAALGQTPVRVGYSQHEGMEQAGWDDSKLELVGDTHPVVHVAAGSHANYFGSALYLGRSGQEGFGCDDTSGATIDVPVRVRTIPSDPAQARTEFPWISYAGHWGQREQSFYNGPTGPSQKTKWSAPISWAEDHGRGRAYAVPAGGLFGTRATDFFCDGVAAGSDALRVTSRNPGPALAALAVLVLAAAWLIRRITWLPSAPFRLTRRRAWGQVVLAGLRLYGSRPLLFVGIGLLSLPLTAVITALQAVVAGVSVEPGVARAQDPPSAWVVVAGAVGLLLAGAATTVVQAASVSAVVELDAGRPVGVRRAFALAFGRRTALLVTFLMSTAVLGVLGLTVILLPVAIVGAVLVALWVPVVVVEDRRGWSALRRSAALVRHQLLKVALLIAAAGALAAAIGPLLGTAVILTTNAPFTVGNLVAGLAYAVLLPLVSVNATYVYADCAVRDRIRRDTPRQDVLEAEPATR